MAGASLWRIEVYPAEAEGAGFRLEADTLLFASLLGGPPSGNETPSDAPERLVLW